MPGFADRLSDQDLADVLTFVRSSWGNTAPAVTSEMMAAVRKSLPEKAPATDLQTRLINGICRSKTR